MCPLHSVSGLGVEGGASNLSQCGGVLFLEVPGVTHSCLQASRASDSFFFFFFYHPGYLHQESDCVAPNLLPQTQIPQIHGSGPRSLQTSLPVC